MFPNSTEFETLSGNLISVISNYLLQLLILKGFHSKLTVTGNIDYKRNYQFFNDIEFKKNF